MDEMNTSINNIAGPMPTIIVTGDLNFPMINWESYRIGSTSADLRVQCERMFTFVERFFLKQIIDKPTRGKNILDLVLVNNEEATLYTEVVQTSLSDHNLILCMTRYTTASDMMKHSHDQEGLIRYNFWDPAVNWDSIRAKLTLNWQELWMNSSSSLDEFYDNFLKVIENVCEEELSYKKKKKTKIIPRDRRLLMKRRRRLKTRIHQSNSSVQISALKKQYEDIENSLIASHKLEEKNNELAALSKIKTNSKFFFKYANKKARTVQTIGPFIIDGECIGDPPRKASALCRQYASVYTSIPYDPKMVRDIVEKPGPRGLDSISFSRENIKNAIKDLKNGSAPGPDGVPTILLKECAEQLSEPISLLWNKSLETGKIPAKLKSGIVSPVFKSGSKAEPKNYRPVVLTSHIIKLFERIVSNEIISYLDKINSWNANQHGFRVGRSCLSQLLEHYQSIIEGLESGCSVDVVYLDFCKAFDKVDHKVLMEKLFNLGVAGEVLDWIGQFLTGREQAVVVDGFISEYAKVGSGVPQGSVLGPLLFLIHVADIDAGIEYAKSSCFADDTRVMLNIKSAEDQYKLQSDLQSVYDWANQNKMAFNDDKFVHLRYQHPRVLLEDQYKCPSGSVIKSEEYTRDLGVLMENDGTFNQQIVTICEKGRRQASWVLRTFETREKEPMLILFKSLVLPILEYCCQLWCPSALGSVRKIESVQRNFTARIRGLENLDYWQRLKELNLYSLERRRDRYIIIYLFKMITGRVPNFIDDKYRVTTFMNIRRGLLCCIPLLNRTAMARHKSLKEDSFAVMGPRLFNAIPSDLRDLNLSLDSFKSKLDKFLMTIHDKPTAPNYHQASRSNNIVSQIESMRSGASSI